MREEFEIRDWEKILGRQGGWSLNKHSGRSTLVSFHKGGLEKSMGKKKEKHPVKDHEARGKNSSAMCTTNA